MKSISKAFSQIKVNKLEKCNPKPGYKDSCEGCKDCRKKRMFFDQDEPIPCDCEYDPLTEFNNASDSQTVTSEALCFTGIVCPVTLQVKFQTTDGWNEGENNVNLNIPSGKIQLTRNTWITFSVLNNDCITFDWITQLTRKKVIEFHLKNVTCGSNENMIGHLTVNQGS